MPNFDHIDFSSLERRAAALTAAVEKGGDVHTNFAAELLGCAPDEVTPTGRRAAKAMAYHTAYTMPPLGKEADE